MKINKITIIINSKYNIYLYYIRGVLFCILNIALNFIVASIISQFSLNGGSRG